MADNRIKLYDREGRNTSSNDPEMMESRIFVGNLAADKVFTYISLFLGPPHSLCAIPFFLEGISSRSGANLSEIREDSGRLST